MEKGLKKTGMAASILKEREWVSQGRHNNFKCIAGSSWLIFLLRTTLQIINTDKPTIPGIGNILPCSTTLQNKPTIPTHCFYHHIVSSSPIHNNNNSTLGSVGSLGSGDRSSVFWRRCPLLENCGELNSCTGTGSSCTLMRTSLLGLAISFLPFLLFCLFCPPNYGTLQMLIKYCSLIVSSHLQCENNVSQCKEDKFYIQIINQSAFRFE